MDTSKFRVMGIPVTEDKDLLNVCETFQKIEEVYDNCLIAMGIRSASIPSVSGNTNISLSNIRTISTK
jgi:hypothetical protein